MLLLESQRQEGLDDCNDHFEKLKEYLRETDYCVIKMYETVVQGGSILEMLKEYKEVLTQRTKVRARINELEEHLN